MKSIILNLLIIVMFNQFFAMASELKFYPMESSPGDSISVEFSGNPRFDKFNEIDLLYYTFNGTDIYPSGNEISLKRTGNIWTGKLQIPDSVVYMMFKVFATGDYIDVVDNNNGLYWEYLVYSKNSSGLKRIAKGSNLRAALSRLGSISANIDRLPEYHYAIKFLENELELYPDNISAELGLITTLFDTKKISSDAFQKRIEALASRSIDENDESAVRSKSRALYAVNEQALAKELETRFSQKHPNSEMSEDILISEISSAESLEKFVLLSKIFFKRFPESINHERVFLAYVSGFMQSDKVNELINDLDSLERVPGYVYARIAKNLFEYYLSKDLLKDLKNRDLLLSLLEKAEARTALQTKNGLTGKPKIYSKGEWLDILDIQLGTIMEFKAEIYTKVEPINAVPLFENALTLLRNNANEDLYEKYIDLLVALGESAKALELSEKAIVRGKISDVITTFHRDACKNLLYMNDSLYSLRADSLYQKSKIYKNEIYLNEILDQDEFQYTLESLEGTYIDFRDLKGKVLVMNFFASWCDPCKTMFPAFQELYNLYKGNPNVELVSVNTLENSNFSLELLKKFVLQNDISFPVARDLMDIIPRQMGVNGLPTLAIFDNNSHVRFLVRGFSSNEKLLDEVAGRVEYLINLKD